MDKEPTIASLIRAGIKRFPKASLAELRRELGRLGVSVSRQTVWQWIQDGTAGRTPTPAQVAALWEALLIPQEKRAAWVRALGLDPIVEKVNNEPYDDISREAV